MARSPNKKKRPARKSPRKTSPGPRRKPAAAKQKAIVAEKQKVIVVLSMHRSGSSAIARGLKALGVDLGDNLMAPIEGVNEKGFWEDLDIYHFHERVLAKAGSAWHKLARLDKDAFLGPSYSDERREAAGLLSAKLKTSEIFAFKDPRTAVLLPLWQCVFEDLDLDDCYLITVRNPLAAAASLNARDGFPMAKGVFLWAKHEIEAVRGTNGKPRIFVSYDRILRDPVDELQRIAAALDLAPPDPESEAIREYRDEFLTPSLRHNIVGAKELERSGLAPGFIVELERLVADWTKAEAGAPIKPNIQQWRSIEARYDEAAPFLDYADHIDDRRLDAERKSKAAETQAQESQARAEEANARLTELQNALAKANEEKQAAADARDRIAGELDQLKRSNAAEIGVLSEAREAAEAKLREAEAALQQKIAECDDYARRIDELSGALEAAREKAAADEAAIEALRKTEAKNAAREEKDAKQIDALEAERAALASRIEEMRRAIEEAVEIAAIETDGVKTQAEIEIAEILLKTESEIATTNDSHEATLEALRQKKAELAKRQKLDEEKARKLEAERAALAAHNAELRSALEEAVEKATAEADGVRTQAEIEIARTILQADAELAEVKAANNSALEALQDETDKTLEILRREMPHSASSVTEAIDALLRERREMRAQSKSSENENRRLASIAAERGRDIERLKSAKQALRTEKREQFKDLLLTRAEVNAIRRSMSWRLTAPLRAAGTIARDPLGGTRQVVSRIARAAWRLLPMPAEQRGRLAATLFSAAPFLFFWSGAYKAWKTEQNAARSSRMNPDSEFFEDPMRPAGSASAVREDEPSHDLSAAGDDRKKKVLIVIHELRTYGAQYLALNMLRTLKRRFGFNVASIAGGPGDLAADYEREGPLAILDAATASDSEIDAAISRFRNEGFRHAIINSSASGWVAPYLARRGIEQIGMVHEMPEIIGEMKLENNLRAFDCHARAVVFPAVIVRDRGAKAAGLKDWRNARILPQGVYKSGDIGDLAEKREARAKIAKRLGLPRDARIALGVGYADHRKGVDIFIEWAKAGAERWPDLHFVWLGKIDRRMQAACDRLLARAGEQERRAKKWNPVFRGTGATTKNIIASGDPDLSPDAIRGNIHFPGFVEDTREFYRAASLYALTSREDPFPSTALEALSAGAPVIMVRKTGGIEDLADHGCVKAIDDETPAAFVKAAALWLDREDQWRAAALGGRDLMRERFGFTSYVGALTDLLGLDVPNISVVVPNYNYARHLEQRLQSILDQTLSPREIIFLDDASTDDSVAVAERVLRAAPVNYRIIRNESNSGDVFAQWRKGVELAKGGLVWIAEADDWADPRFLETAARAFARDDVALSFTQSNQAAEDGRVLANDYQDYVRDVSPDKWTRDFVNDGPAEIREGLSVKNTIPNVSAALFRRAPLLDVLKTHAREIASYRVAGDWCVYANLLRAGALAYSAAPLNFHRRHEESVTIARFDLAELAEIARMQAFVAREFAPPGKYSCMARAYLENLVAHFALEQKYSRREIEAAMAGSGLEVTKK